MPREREIGRRLEAFVENPKLSKRVSTCLVTVSKDRVDVH